jgi:hypothetical protein
MADDAAQDHGSSSPLSSVHGKCQDGPERTGKAWRLSISPAVPLEAAPNRACGAVSDWVGGAVACRVAGARGGNAMLKFLLWLLLLVVCWPLAILAVLLWPLVWLVMLPFRLIGLVVEGVFAFLRSLVMLPARVLGGGPGRV